MRQQPAAIEEITREDFAAYVGVQRSGVVNMLDTRVCNLAGITAAVHAGIIKHYEALTQKWPDIVA